jgi:DNA polymerase-1
MGNALGQSWGLLNNRASVEFMRKVREHPEFRLKIRQCAHIHDAQYFIIDEDMATLLFMNEHLVEAVKWQDDPLIWHPEVKLGGELSVFWPTWAEEMEIPNGADEDKIRQCVDKHMDNLASKLKAA